VKLSVVVPTHNKRDLLGRTLDALAEQEVPGGWEVVVVDDGSSDGTMDLLAGRVGALAGHLHVVRSEHNRGRAAARNLGVRAAVGHWVLFLDDDILAPPGLLAAHLAVLEAHPRCGTIGLVRTAPELMDAPHLDYLDSRGLAKVKGDRVPARYFVTQNAAVPRAAFLAVGGFDEGFSGYGFEDVELAFRLEDRLGLVFRPVRWPVPQHLHHHSLEQYLLKRREVGRVALARLAARHPHRIPEMRLHWILGDERGRGWRALIVRRAARGWPAEALERLLTHWPTQAPHEPRGRLLYHRLMDALVIFAYSQGLANSHENQVIMS
jgi:glycosyltransferase involved in cell wall biosynthesis